MRYFVETKSKSQLPDIVLSITTSVFEVEEQLQDGGLTYVVINAPDLALWGSKCLNVVVVRQIWTEE